MFFPGTESRFQKKILLFRLLSRDFTAPELFTITPAYWYPASASRLFAKILTTECQSHWESNGFWLDVFQPISGRVTKRASHVLKTKVDVSRFVAVTWVSLKPILNCLRFTQRCHPRKNKQKKKKTINTDKTQPTLFKLLNKDRASEPVSETQDSQAQDNSQSDSEAAEKSCSTDSGQSG